MKIYTFYDHSKSYPFVMRLEANNLDEASELVKVAGHNPNKLSINIGLRVVLFNSALVTRQDFRHRGKIYERYYSSGLVFESKIVDNKDDAYELVKNTVPKSIVFTNVFFRYLFKEHEHADAFFAKKRLSN